MYLHSTVDIFDAADGTHQISRDVPALGSCASHVGSSHDPHPRLRRRTSLLVQVTFDPHRLLPLINPPTCDRVESPRYYAIPDTEPVLISPPDNARLREATSTILQAERPPLRGHMYRQAVPSANQFQIRYTAVSSHTQYSEMATPRVDIEHTSPCDMSNRSAYFRVPPTTHPTHDETQPTELALKRRRKRASPVQLEVLTTAFVRDPYPSKEEHTRLGQQLQMTSRAVEIWCVLPLDSPT